MIHPSKKIYHIKWRQSSTAISLGIPPRILIISAIKWLTLRMLYGNIRLIDGMLNTAANRLFDFRHISPVPYPGMIFVWQRTLPIVSRRVGYYFGIVTSSMRFANDLSWPPPIRELRLGPSKCLQEVISISFSYWSRVHKSKTIFYRRTSTRSRVCD